MTRNADRCDRDQELPDYSISIKINSSKARYKIQALATLLDMSQDLAAEWIIERFNARDLFEDYK